MIKAIIEFSVRNKLIILLLIAGLISAGIYSLSRLPIDAVPDITNNQVQIVTVSGSLAPQEVEQFITYPVEIAVANIPDVTEIRSISRFGLSVVTVVFEPGVPILQARQYVKEQLGMAEQEIPPGLGTPELMPITTGLGEIYQYVLRVKPGYEDQYSPMELRTIQDWIVKRQMAGTKGIIEISSFGGYLKQYEVALNPVTLQGYDIAISEVFDALARNNQNSGGSYIEKNTNAYYIRTEGMVQSFEDIEQIVVATRNGTPVLIRDVGEVQLGSPKRFGAMTMDGKGEAVGGITLMFKGANSSEAIANVHDRVEQVRESLPEGIELYPYLDRSVLVGKTINTVKNNLLEGGLIVVFVLVLLLGNLRAGLIVASVIPLAMLFALILMSYFGLSANLMSLGAIDFGIVVDGAVIIVEGVLHAVFTYHVGKQLTQAQMDDLIIDESAKLFRSAVFGVFIILTVFIPIMTLTGIEGKMFRPMAMTFSFAVLGALILSLTYVPMMTAWVMPRNIKAHKTFADRIVNFLRKLYRPTLEGALRLPQLVLGATLAVLIGSVLLFRTLGAEFLPTLEEGDLAMQMAIQPGSSLQESVKTAGKAEKILLDNFPEVEHVVSKIGTAEVPTDPMAIEDADIMIILKPQGEWVSATDREGLVNAMKEKLDVIAGASFEFTQPIQLRFNELLTGAKTDIAVKIFGENTTVLKQQADQAADIIKGIPGAGDVKVEQTEGLPQLMVEFNRPKIAEYGLDIEQLNTLVRTAFAGETAGVVFENERKFDLVVRLDQPSRQELDLQQLFVHLPDGRSLPMSEIARVHYTEGPMQISREGTRRRINIGVNVRDRDVASLVADIEAQLKSGLDLPAGYYIKYGGQFENLEAAKARLGVAVPAALALIFVLLYFTFGKLKYALMIFTAVPTAAVGGILGLWARGMPFSISAGVGFIALFGVAVLNGIVLISHFNRLRYEEGYTDIRKVVIDGGLARMRPVIMTATVAALGFLPMALSTSNGAEVQKPLATVVIGGLITATLLTLLVLPVLYYLANKNLKPAVPGAAVIAMLLLATPAMAQQPLTLDYATQQALELNPDLQNSTLSIQQAQLGITAAREIPQTEFMAGFGQYNTTMGDYQVSITQPLSPFGLNKKQEAAARAQLALSGSQQALLEHQVTFGIRQARQNWLAEQARLQLYQRQELVFQNLADRAALQLRAGAIDRLSYTLAQQQLTQAQSATRQALQQEEQAFRRFQQLAYSPASVRPSDSLQALISGTADTTAALQAFLRPLEQEMQAAAAKAEVEAQRLQPQLSFGYMQQSIRPDLPLNAVQIGLRAPIFQKSQRARIAQAELEATKAAQQLQGQRQQLEQERQMAQVQWQQLARQLEEQGPALLAQARQLRQLAQLQLEQGEVNYFQYAQSLNAALSSELERINLTVRYNQAMLYLEFLSQ
ncbi:CusA/CzcA family heavy metal efflux RND transporter [Phaeodactylibacter sp.]|uniref:CusA/CzcA family heavy metal efflux RND transporter n=1 Tax=Phaeodactylibacter sp. TaxID=1940289 RepID=UPI0025F1BEBF|nr:CusA/CzcA family heavy metal efflux RND transporter [Phaeodactylibacter sp.]MCI4648547.1 CusA/CzcA family heavy metal efflux RND transporter [Phaeodactylibacter sp.]MCI5090105.1 CusA/CzcA family heavy metal efflux RND transporter [Phaeodactylibacter sp.]